MSNWDPTPWAIGGGADNSAETARTAVWASTNGAEGIVGINDLKVVPFDVPGSGVNVTPGGLLALSRYAGADRQTYTARLGVVDPVDVANTGSSGGRVDMVAIIIDDPSQTGDGSAVPDDPTSYQYVKTVVIPNVGSTATRLQDVPGYTYATGYAIARIAQPASNGTITAAMISDLRAVANPRKDPHTFAHAQVADDTTQPLQSTATSGEFWPDQSGSFYVDVPTWATRVQIVAMWVQVIAKVDSAGRSAGRLWVQLGSNSDANVTASQDFGWNTNDASSGSQRQVFAVVDSRAVPAGMRGRNIQLGMKGRITMKSGDATLVADAISGITLQITFLEEAE